jgi:hypothetical protein
MKKVILGLLMLVVGGCGYESADTNKDMVIVGAGVSLYGDGTCYYECKGSTTSSFIEFFSDNRWLFYDSCGKYSIGDTIVIGEKITNRVGLSNDSIGKN